MNGPETVPTIDPNEIGPEACYKLASGLIVPRPIGWIGSTGPHGHNLAPYSFFNMVSGAPPTVIFSTGLVEGSEKDTLANVRATGEFTVNIVSEDLAPAMNATSAAVARDVDEFELAGLTAVPGDMVSAPRVGEARASLECVANNFVPVGTPPRGNVVVFGEIVLFHVADGVVDGTRVDLDALAPVGRTSGPGYVRTRDRFEMLRPS
ncbi:MAG: flavin reductase family protein [Acidimicrobiia bacterium]|nr:flavin reductase family protein [Acidimicrobiia bacterium]MDH5295095.1 flavin reductase family protein [Acidimicrobiia bacterium]